MPFCSRNDERSVLMDSDKVFDILPELKDGDKLVLHEAILAHGDYIKGKEFLCINMTKIGDKLVMNVSTSDPIMEQLIKNSDMANCVLETKRARA